MYAGGNKGCQDGVASSLGDDHGLRYDEKDKECNYCMGAERSLSQITASQVSVEEGERLGASKA